MASLANVLASIPGYGGYAARNQMNREQEQGDLRQAGGLMAILAKVRAAQQEQAMRDELAALGPNPTQESLAAVAAKRASAGDILKSQTSSLDRKAILEAARIRSDSDRAQRLQEITLRGNEAIERVREAAAQNRITREDADRREAAMRENLVRLTASLRPAPENKPPAGYRWLPDGNLQPIAGGPADKPQPDPSIAPAAMGSAVSQDVRGPSATGGSGFFGGIANTLADMVGAPMPYQDIEKATQALKNLEVQTITIAQDAVPGRPSNYLMKQIEKLSVPPASLFMADQRAQTRLQQTRDMLQQEANRMEREVLGRPANFTPAQLAKYRNSFGQLRQLVGEYDTILRSFGGGPRTQSGNIGGAPAGVPPPPPGFKIDP